MQPVWNPVRWCGNAGGSGDDGDGDDGGGEPPVLIVLDVLIVYHQSYGANKTLT